MGGKVLATMARRRAKKPRRKLSDRLSSHHIFAHRKLLERPKEIRNRNINGINYETLHTGGFLRLCTLRCRMYWCEQNTRAHQTPDWKLHFGVQHTDLEVGWDVVAAQFLKHRMCFGMKVIYMEEGLWPKCQRGREITVYIYQHFSEYGQVEHAVEPAGETRDAPRATTNYQVSS